MKIAVAVHGRFHGFDLAAGLHRHEVLARLFTTYPEFAARRFVPADLPVTTAPWLEVWRRAYGRVGLGSKTDYFVARHFARFVAARLPDADVVVAWSGAAREIIRAAQSHGASAVVERGSSHIVHQTEILREAHARWNLQWHETDPRLIEREISEYETADLIVTSSRYARSTFVSCGIPENKVLSNPYGVDLTRFSPGSRHECPDHGKPRRLLFVGRVGVRKGVPHLIEAFSKMPSAWELHLVGPVEPGMAEVLRRLPMDRVVLRGPLPGALLPDEYRAADLFCLPSLEEGFPLVLLQAMASKLPVVATPATGADDAGVPGRSWLSVPEADTLALAATLKDLADDHEMRSALGERALAAVRDGFSWAAYVERAMSIYRGLVAGKSSLLQRHQVYASRLRNGHQD